LKNLLPLGVSGEFDTRGNGLGCQPTDPGLVGAMGTFWCSREDSLSQPSCHIELAADGAASVAGTRTRGIEIALDRLAHRDAEGNQWQHHGLSWGGFTPRVLTSTITRKCLIG
jgi:hypothetical protein